MKSFCYVHGFDQKLRLYNVPKVFLARTPMRTTSMKSILRSMVMLDNVCPHFWQPIGTFRFSNRMIFSACSMECLGKSSEFDRQLFVITYIDAVQFYFKTSNK
jgi:hypothetical protein